MVPTLSVRTDGQTKPAGKRSPARQLRAFAEHAALASAIAVPLVFSVFTDRIFEAEKAGLIRVLGAAALIGSLAALWPSFRSEPVVANTDAPARAAATARFRQLISVQGSALTIALVAVLLSELVSTAVSVAPMPSIWGSYDRAQGLVTTAALIALASAAALIAMQPRGPSRLADAIGLTVLPTGLYALIQRAGLDPIPWLGDVVIRVSGSAGSSTLFAAHLAIALPFTALGAVSAWKAVTRPTNIPQHDPEIDPTGRGPAGRRLHNHRLLDLRLAIRLLALAVGVTALVLSGSRGPALGLAAGFSVALLASAAIAGSWRRALAVVAAVFGGIAFVIALNRAPAAFSPIVDLPMIDRLSTALDPGRSTSRVRLLLWEGSVDAIASNPDRLAFGFGPETTELVWAPYYPSILAYDEPRGWVPDRAHSFALDTLLTNGVFGLIALLMLFGAAAIACLDVLGLTVTPATRRSVIASMLFGGLLCGAIAGLLDGAWRIIAPVSGLGLVAGLSIWLAAATWRRRAAGLSFASKSEEPSSSAEFGDAGFAVAALGALVAHFVELQVSFAVGATRSVFFLVCGALLGLAIRRARSSTESGGSRGDRPASAALDLPVRKGDSRLLPSIIAITAIYSFARPGLTGGGAPIVVAIVVASAIGCLFALANRPTETWHALLRLAVIAGAYGAVHFFVIARLTVGPEEAVLGSATSLALYVASLLGLIAYEVAGATVSVPKSEAGRAIDDLGSAHGTGGPHGTRVGNSFSGRHVATGLAALSAFALAVPLWILPSTADALQKEARLAWEAPVPDLRARGESGRAESLLSRARERYARAARLVSYQPRHAFAEAFAAEVHGDIVSERLDRAVAQSNLGEEFDVPGGPGEYSPGLLGGDTLRWAKERDRAFELALGHIAGAGRLMGPSPSPPIARARALRVWAERTRTDAQRSERLDTAASAYHEAIAAAPNWPEVREEAARTALLRGLPDEAVAMCAEALRIDPFYSRCHATLARAYAAAGDDEAAAEAWSDYFSDSRNAGDADAYRERLRTLLALGRTTAALDAARDVLRIAPDDARTHADLAVLLERSGDLDAARDSAATGALLAPNDPGISALVEQLGQRQE